MDVGSACVAACEVVVGVQPGDRALDHPTVASEARTVASVAFRDARSDPAFAQFCSMARRVISTVGVEAEGTELAVATNRWHAIHKLNELGNVVAVGGAQRDRERNILRLDDYVMLAARTGAIDWRGDCLLAPPFARTCELSTTARDQSICPVSCNSSKSTWCRRCHTPASLHSCKRRQHVIPDPQPISWGRCSHGIPVFKTNRIPVNAALSGTRGRPVTRGARTGKTGSIRTHNSSLNKGLAMTQDFDSPTTNPTLC